MSEVYDNAANEAGIALTTQLFRLLRNAQLHEVKMMVAQGTTASGAASLQEIARGAGGFIVAMFAGETVFVNGQPVRAPRSVYENILVVGGYLKKYGFNEITIRSSLRPEDLADLLSLLVHNERNFTLPSSITLQYVDPARLLGEADGAQTIEEKVAAVYGAATVLVRRCNDQIREDDPRLMRHVKRVSQRLVTLTREGFAELLVLARRPAAPTDHAAISVNAAVIGVLAGRALTEDVNTLLRITMAALQAEIGKPRVAGMYRSDGFQTAFVPQLNQQMRQRLPGSTAVMLLQAGRAAERPLMRAVVSYEAAHLADGALLGWPYEGQIPPTVEAVIGSLAIRVAFAISTAGNPDDLVRTLAEAELGKVERAGLDLIYSVLGLVPAGLPVEMTDGWRGVVASSGDDFATLEKAHVVMLLDQHRKPVEPRVVRAGGERGWIKSVVTREDALLSREYEAYASRNRDGFALPSTTGVLQPEATDHLANRGTLDFDADAATGIVDAGAAAKFLPPTHASGASSPAARPSDPAPAPPAPAPPAAAAPAVPSAFRPSSEASAEVPKQFQSSSSSPRVGSLPKQFESGSKAAEEPAAKVPGAWVRPQKAAPVDATPPAKKADETEPKKDDESSEDGDFDALANIVLFD